MKKLLPILLLFCAIFNVSVGYAYQAPTITSELYALGCDGCDDDETAMFLPISLDREVIPIWFKKEFADGTPITTMKVVNEDKQSYFIEEGSTAKGDCRISRTPVGVLDYGEKHVVYMLAVRKTTETCAGKGCSRCKFSQVPGGGCLCLRGTGDCNHTIVKSATMLR